MTDSFGIEMVKKQIKTTKEKTKNETDESAQDMLKDLTFNVHLNSDDLEAKRNLVLPYELVG